MGARTIQVVQCLYNKLCELLLCSRNFNFSPSQYRNTLNKRELYYEENLRILNTSRTIRYNKCRYKWTLNAKNIRYVLSSVQCFFILVLFEAWRSTNNSTYRSSNGKYRKNGHRYDGMLNCFLFILTDCYRSEFWEIFIKFGRLSLIKPPLRCNVWFF